MADAPALDADTLDAARLALGGARQRLGLHGLALDQFAAMVIEAVGPVISERTAGAWRSMSKGLLAAGAARIDELTIELTAAQAQVAPLVARVNELAAQLDAANAMVDRARRTNGRLVQALTQIEALPYIGEEPEWRRKAREAIT